jgi:hypothetical protein
MPQPRKQARRTGARAGSTKSTSRGAKSAGGAAKKRSTRTQTKAEPGVEAAANRVRELNERIIAAGKLAGRGTLDAYESALKTIADSLERGPGASDIEWVSRIATSQAEFIRDMTQAWTKAARKALE